MILYDAFRKKFSIKCRIYNILVKKCISGDIVMRLFSKLTREVDEDMSA